MPESFPWELRLEHEGYASIRLERAGRSFRFDPVTPSEVWAALGETPAALPIADDDVVVLSFAEHERLVATAHALRDGRRPMVIAPTGILEWLGQFGDVEGNSGPSTVDGVRVELLEYEPIAYAEGMEIAYKALSLVTDPRRSARRLMNRVRLPRCKPVTVGLTLPSGKRLVHLNTALHQGASEAWMSEAIARYGGADWLIVGMDHGYEAAFMDRVERFTPKRLLVTDLVSDVRRSMGMPTTVLTPYVDELTERGQDVYVFASRSSFRFE